MSIYSFDVSMLRLLKHRKKHSKYFRQLDRSIVTEGTYKILSDFDRYYTMFPEHESIDWQMFIPRMASWNAAVQEESLAARMVAIKAAARGEVTESEEAALETEIANAIMSNEVTKINDKYADGEVENIGFEMARVLDTFKKNAGKSQADWVDEGVGTILAEDDDEGGYNWRLSCLRKAMRGLRAGDFGIIAGRPDTGKTSFIASEVTHIATQIPAHRNVVWLNNESVGRRIVPRIYQAALDLTRSQMVSLNQAGKLEPAYDKIMGRRDKIRVIDIHGMSAPRVESIIEAHDAEVVIYDMLDNIKGFGHLARPDLALEEMYKWARECAVKHNHIGLATSQISADGEGEMFPALGMLKDSKSGKQGTADFQLMIGVSPDPTLQAFRYLSLPKNKLRREGERGDPRATVQFRPEVARYIDSTEFTQE